MRIAKMWMLVVMFFALSAVTLSAGENYINLSAGTLTASYSVGQANIEYTPHKCLSPSIPSYFYNAQITSIVVTSVKGANSVGNITVWLRAERNGVLVKEVSKNWASTLTFNDFNTEDPRMNYCIWFTASRPTTTTIAGVTLTGVNIKVNYSYTDTPTVTQSTTTPATESTDTTADTHPPRKRLNNLSPSA